MLAARQMINEVRFIGLSSLISILYVACWRALGCPRAAKFPIQGPRKTLYFTIAVSTFARQMPFFATHRIRPKYIVFQCFAKEKGRNHGARKQALNAKPTHGVEILYTPAHISGMEPRPQTLFPYIRDGRGRAIIRGQRLQPKV